MRGEESPGKRPSYHTLRMRKPTQRKISGLLTVPSPAPVGQHHPLPKRGRRAGGRRCEGGRLRRKGGEGGGGQQGRLSHWLRRD